MRSQRACTPVCTPGLYDHRENHRFCLKFVQNGNVGGGVKTLKLLFTAKKETTFFVGVALCLDFVICWCVLLRVALALVLWRWVCEVEPKCLVLQLSICFFVFLFQFQVSSLKVHVLLAGSWNDELDQKIKFHLVSTIIRCLERCDVSSF